MLKNVRQFLTIRNFISGRDSPNPPSTCRRAISLEHNGLADLPSSDDIIGNTTKRGGRGLSAIQELVDSVRKERLDDLLTSLKSGGKRPSRAWVRYLDVLGAHHLPLRVHQLALRRCVPDAQELRTTIAIRMQKGRFPKKQYMYKERLATILKSMRSAGCAPELDDYHFILSQYAAVGYYAGSMETLKEMRRGGTDVGMKTYGLCLQAVAHRLSLPLRENDEDRIRNECLQMTKYILSCLARDSKQVTSVVLDLATRILKETGEVKGFFNLIRNGYGIDLSFPDTRPMNGETGGPVQPVSTAALTTIVDFLGRHQMISKMVLAFEVFSTPLQPADTSRNVDEDDEEDDFVLPSVQRRPPFPSTLPNTTTYNTIIRQCAKAKHHVLLRHYVLDAIDKDRFYASRMRDDLASNKPHSDIDAPLVSVNRATFLPVLGLSGSDRDLYLISWVLRENRQALKAKRADLKYYQEVLEKHRSNADDLDARSTPTSQRRMQSLPKPSQQPTKFFTPSSSQHTDVVHVRSYETHPLDLDLDNSYIETHPHKPFDLNLHIRLLERDVLQMEHLDARIGIRYDKMCILERKMLSRRVENGQDIYLASMGARVVVGEKDWERIVDSQPTRAMKRKTKGGKQRKASPRIERRKSDVGAASSRTSI